MPFLFFRRLTGMLSSELKIRLPLRVGVQGLRWLVALDEGTVDVAPLLGVEVFRLGFSFRRLDTGLQDWNRASSREAAISALDAASRKGSRLVLCSFPIVRSMMSGAMLTASSQEG